jgi:hypothetical protein
MHLYKKLLLAALLFVTTPSIAVSDERYRPISDKATLEECSACHMAFQSQMLPERSWKKIMSGLSDHFGEDASLDQTTVKHITQYLTDNAADQGWLSGKFLRGIKDGMTPMLITETPYWVREHNEEVPPSAWQNPKVKSKANCTACHPQAKRGNYDDD